MLIQLERIPARRIRASELSCSVPRCAAGATWQLSDLDAPAFNDANLGERLCCAAHITATYLNLRGANVLQRAAAARDRSQHGPDRRRKPKRMSLAHPDSTRRAS